MCQAPECIGEFEVFHSITIKLEECPHCRESGRGSQLVKRLINGGGSGKGIVEQTVADFKASLPEEGRKMVDRARRDEKYLANLVGEGRFESNLRKK